MFWLFGIWEATWCGMRAETMACISYRVCVSACSVAGIVLFHVYHGYFPFPVIGSKRLVFQGAESMPSTSGMLSMQASTLCESLPLWHLQEWSWVANPVLDWSSSLEKCVFRVIHYRMSHRGTPWVKMSFCCIKISFKTLRNCIIPCQANVGVAVYSRINKWSDIHGHWCHIEKFGEC